MDSSLLPFFAPRGVAVVGASTSPEKLGYGVARNLLQCGYAGAVHLVGQRPGSLFDRPLHTRLADLPDPVDLAILIVPPAAAPDSIAACGRCGIQAAVLVSSGFREVGPEGAALEQACLQAARAHHIRLLGPNCIGTIDTHFPLDTTFLQPPMPTPGGIGFISHSGAFCAAVIDWSRKQGFGFSRIVSLGNQADVNETDMLPLLAADEHTRVIVLYMESVGDGRRFVEIAREVTRSKPVIALKVGRFGAGQRAAASHTGALAASDVAFEAAFEKAGILRAETTEQLFDWARALERCPLPRGRRVAILTNAGGPGVIAADALEQHGLELAPLGTATREALSASLPPAASVNNPVDMLASASPEQYAQSLALLLQDNEVDSALAILPPPPMFRAETVAETIVRAAAAQPNKPVVIALLGSTLVEKAAEVFRRAGLPSYPFPERAASALAALVRRAQTLASQTADRKAAATEIHAGWSGEQVFELLRGYGIPVASPRLARELSEAKSLAAELGFPLVLKIASPDIPHKSDAGGVILNITTPEQLESAYAQIMRAVQRARPEARIDGVNLQRQIPAGQEVIVGMVRDPQFGPLMLFGAGGVEVEGLRDVAFALAPLSPAEARALVRKTWAGRRLAGFRNLPPADEAAALDVLIKLARLAIENEQILEIEINPLQVLASGAVAVDARLTAR